MDALKELVKILNRKRLSKIDVFDKTFLNQNNTNLYYKLYEGLESGKITDDTSAAMYLYKSDEKDAKFRKLKSRFKDKILKSILLLNGEEVFNNERGKAYYESLTFNQTLEIIIQLTGTTKLVYELVKENYSTPLKFSFYDILKNYSYYLITYYALKGDKKALLLEEEKYLKYVELAQKEQFAKQLYMRGIVDFVGQARIYSESLNEVKKDLDKLLEIKNEIQNTEIDFYYFYLALTYNDKCNNTDRILIN